MSDRQSSTPANEPDVEAHVSSIQLAPGHTIDVARVTVEPVNGDPVVLEPAGVDANGDNMYRVVSGLPDVEAHGGHRCC